MNAHRLAQALQALRPALESAGAFGDRERRLPPEVVSGMRDAGLFHMLLPVEIGGEGAPLSAFMEAAEVVAALDGSSAWCLVQGSISATQVAAQLPLAVGVEILGDRHTILSNGTGAGARAVAVPGGYRLTGEWPFASGCTHATWLKGAALLHDVSGAPLCDESGQQAQRSFLFPAEDATLKDMWHVGGLRGTGSNAIIAEDVFVPVERSVDLAHDPPQVGYPLGRLPYAEVAAAGFCAVSLGIARGALDAFAALACSKTPRGASLPLAEHPVVQADFARATARVLAARSLVYAQVASAWEVVCGGHALDAQARALLRLAATDATWQAAAAVDSVYHASGATAIFLEHPFERRFRDIHAITQQTQANPRHYEWVGKALFAGTGTPSQPRN